MGKKELVAYLGLSLWCPLAAIALWLTVPWIGQQCVIVVFSDHINMVL